MSKSPHQGPRKKQIKASRNRQLCASDAAQAHSRKVLKAKLVGNLDLQENDEDGKPMKTLCVIMSHGTGKGFVVACMKICSISWID